MMDGAKSPRDSGTEDPSLPDQGNFTIQPVRCSYGKLDCIVIDGGPQPSIPVILCHGYGAQGHDLAGLGMEWLRMLNAAGSDFRFVFPAAPLSLASQGMPDGLAWWPLNMARLLEMAGASRFDELHDEEPPGMPEAREILAETVRAVFQEMSIDLDDTKSRINKQPNRTWAFGGFSQGAMLTLDASLRSDLPAPQLLLQYSGTMVCRTQWRDQLNRLKQTTVLQSHGKLDPILPFDSARKLERMLLDAKIKVDFHEFNGPHTIHPETIARTAVAFHQLVKS